MIMTINMATTTNVVSTQTLQPQKTTDRQSNLSPEVRFTYRVGHIGTNRHFQQDGESGVLGVEIKGSDWANEETLISDHNSIGNLYGRRIFQQRLKIIISSSPLKTKF
jgi:hypothetical protein